MKTVTTNELEAKIEGGEEFYLIDVLSPQSFEVRHIPGAINIPNGPEFLQRVEEAGAKKDSEIIVYCSSSSCGASPHAASVLEEAGYTNVTHYKDGLAGWQEAGNEFVSA